MYISIVRIYVVLIVSVLDVKTRLLKKTQVFPFGYLIIDSVAAPHDKIDVSRQLIKTVQFSLRDAYGTVINLHGAAISFSLVSVTIDELVI